MLKEFAKYFSESYAPVFRCIEQGKKEEAISYLPLFEKRLVQMAQKKPVLLTSLYETAQNASRRFDDPLTIIKPALQAYLASPYKSDFESMSWGRLTVALEGLVSKEAEMTGCSKRHPSSFNISLPKKAEDERPRRPSLMEGVENESYYMARPV